MKKKTGILLINLGTPDSPKPSDVYRYLIEFLTDSRVIDVPWLKRQLLVRGLIVPTRYKQSAKSYKEIWMPEGSPLLVYGLRVKKALQEALGEDFIVELSMRYRSPSIEAGIEKLMSQNLDEMIIFPLFPQYASATTGSVYQKVMDVLRSYTLMPKITFMGQFAAHPSFIAAFSQLGRRYPLEKYDHILFSFHGLPERQLRSVNAYGYCLNKKDCCQTACSENKTCYSAQCYETAYGIADLLNLKSENYTICFQSRLGKEPWLQPYASEVIHQLAKKGYENVLVFCPSFVCDCLETIYEFGVEYNAEFKKAGGGKLELVEGLNEHPFWIQAMKEIILNQAEKACPLEACLL